MDGDAEMFYLEKINHYLTKEFINVGINLLYPNCDFLTGMYEG
jgi:hypothetical protein